MPTEFSGRTRTQNIESLKTDLLDVLVIGGGIVGAGVVRDLALNGGLRVGLIEQSDFASGTSSATSQLVHGGFRYLLKRDIQLVKKARQERDTLRRIAPNLVTPIPLALLCYKGDPYPLVGMQLAASYYNRLSQTAVTENAVTLRDAAKIRRLVGPIATETLKGCVLLWDSTVDDARLTLVTLKDAHLHGAVVTNYVRFLGFAAGQTGNGRYTVLAEDARSGERFQISARKIVAATGPWSDAVWQKDPSYDGTERLQKTDAKGAHLLLPRFGKSGDSGGYGLVTFTQLAAQHRRNPRVIFVLPGPQNTSIIGTTETTPESDISAVRPSAAEVKSLLSEARRLFPQQRIGSDAVIAAYAGTRPLIAPGTTAHRLGKTGAATFVSREHLITESASGVIYLYGGKLTTHRQMAEETVDRLASDLNVPRTCETAERPLPNASGDDVSPPDAAAERLLRRYGAGYRTIQRFITEDRSLAVPITPELPFLKAEILYACWGEMALTLEDILWRRTRIGWTPGQGLDIAPKIAQLLVDKRGWNATEIGEQVQAYRERIRWLNFNLRDAA